MDCRTIERKIFCHRIHLLGVAIKSVDMNLLMVLLDREQCPSMVLQPLLFDELVLNQRSILVINVKQENIPYIHAFDENPVLAINQVLLEYLHVFFQIL